MRTSLIASLAALLAFASPVSAATKKSKAPAAAKKPKPATPKAAEPSDENNEGEEGEGEEGEGGETGGMEVEGGQTGQVRLSPTSGGRETAPGEVHTVVRGDTLWDLSRSYLGNPWYWPKVWSYNPEIANPHWIYPGNQVRFFPAGEEVPSRVEVGNAPGGGQPPEEVQGAEMISGTEQEAAPVEVTGKLTPTIHPSRVVRDGFVTQKELDEAGTVTGSLSDAIMLSYPDDIYLSFKHKGDAHVGDRFVLYHTASEIKHPITGARYGYLTKLLGTVKVISVGDQLVTAQITDTWEPISRGDLVGPPNERLGEVMQPRPNEREVKGYVIGSLFPSQPTMLGEFQTVVIDRGSKDGVQAGNTFTVLTRSDPGPELTPPNRPAPRRQDLPWEDIATCIVVEVKEIASSCLVTRSLREFGAGDHVEMRVGKGSGQPVSQR